MDFIKAQQNMRDAYFDGGPGMLVSGLVWLIAGLIGQFVGVQAAVLTLFIGGMLIFPGGQQIAKLLGRAGSHESDNPLGKLALEGTFLLFIGIFLAFVLVQFRADFFFPTMLLIIGGRYLTFQTIYGLKIYWIVGGMLAVAGGLCLAFSAPFAWGGFIGGMIEIVGSIIIVAQGRSNDA
ncbi:MAG: hypothetical protein AAF902_04120 [Chloroflexota bacterium]